MKIRIFEIECPRPSGNIIKVYAIMKLEELIGKPSLMIEASIFRNAQYMQKYDRLSFDEYPDEQIILRDNIKRMIHEADAEDLENLILGHEIGSILILKGDSDDGKSKGHTE